MIGLAKSFEVPPIADPLCELTELLRNKTPGDYNALYAKITAKTNELAVQIC
jgi:hypothetical protein